MMKLNQMKAFTELMISGSVSEAARNLHRTQPAISALIARLEEDLGIKLFERRNSRLHPVPEAQYLFEECTELLRRMDNISDNMKRIKALKCGEVKIASMPGPSIFLMPELISRHSDKDSDIRYTMVTRSSESVYQLVGTQQYDLGIVDYDEDSPSETPLITSQRFKFRCLCAVPMSDPLSQQTSVHVTDLDNCKLATLYPEEPLYNHTEKIFASCHSRMNVQFMTQNFIPLLTFVEKQMAYAIVDPMTAESYRLYKGGNAGIVFLPVEPAITFDIAVITPLHRPISVVAKHFTEQVVEEILRIEKVH